MTNKIFLNSATSRMRGTGRRKSSLYCGSDVEEAMDISEGPCLPAVIQRAQSMDEIRRPNSLDERTSSTPDHDMPEDMLVDDAASGMVISGQGYLQQVYCER